MDNEFFTEDREHLKKIADILQRVYEGNIKKVSISISPRAGKSYIISLFCAWLLGLNPTGSIMRNSYSQTLANKFSYDVRDMVRLPKYIMIFPDIRLSKDKTAITGWNLNTAKQVSYFCAGVGGSITGFGCDLVSILDDPVKNFEEACSDLVMDNKWNWYTSTHKTRHENNCPEIHIATRWSNNDIIGRLKDDNYFDESIEIPALIDGKSYCESIRTTAELLELKAITDDVIFSSIWQQEPIQAKGLLFPKGELNRFSMKDINVIPDGVVGVTDVADEGDDYLCSPVGYIYSNKVYIVDVVFTQEPVEITEPLVASKIIQHKENKHRCESNNGGKPFAKNVAKIISGVSGCSMDWKTTTTNKETRILMRSGYIKAYYYFRDDYEIGSDYDKFMNQLTTYLKMGKNKHDDAPDGLTLMCEFLDVENTNYWG